MDFFHVIQDGGVTAPSSRKLWNCSALSRARLMLELGCKNASNAMHLSSNNLVRFVSPVVPFSFFSLVKSCTVSACCLLSQCLWMLQGNMLA